MQPYQCPHCQSVALYPDSARGSSVACKACGRSYRLTSRRRPLDYQPRAKRALTLFRRKLDPRPIIIALGTGASLCIVWFFVSAVGFIPDELRIVNRRFVDLSDDNTIAEAMGFVIVGASITASDGRHAEIPISTGSAFAIDPSGIMLTNRHIVQEFQHMIKAPRSNTTLVKVEPILCVVVQRERFSAEIIYEDANADLALLKVDKAFRHRFRLARNPDLSRNQGGHAIGFPAFAMEPVSVGEVMEEQQSLLLLESFLLGRDTRLTLDALFKSRDYECVSTSGNVVRSYTERLGTQWLEHDALVGPGNSGGPFITIDGVVLAMNTSVVTTDPGARGPTLARALVVDQFYRQIRANAPSASWKGGG